MFLSSIFLFSTFPAMQYQRFFLFLIPFLIFFINRFLNYCSPRNVDFIRMLWKNKAGLQVDHTISTMTRPCFFEWSIIKRETIKKCVNCISIKFVILHIEIKFIKSVNFKEAHIANHLMLLTETFAVKLLQIVVSDVSSKKVPVRILLIELTKTIIFSRLRCKFMTSQDPQGFFCQSKADVKCKQHMVLFKIIYSLPSFLLFVLFPYQ